MELFGGLTTFEVRRYEYEKYLAIMGVESAKSNWEPAECANLVIKPRPTPSARSIRSTP